MLFPQNSSSEKLSTFYQKKERSTFSFNWASSSMVFVVAFIFEIASSIPSSDSFFSVTRKVSRGASKCECPHLNSGLWSKSPELQLLLKKLLKRPIKKPLKEFLKRLLPIPSEGTYRGVKVLPFWTKIWPIRALRWTTRLGDSTRLGSLSCLDSGHRL